MKLLYERIWQTPPTGTSFRVVSPIRGVRAIHPYGHSRHCRLDGVNLAVAVYLLLSLAGVMGLLVGLLASFSSKIVPAQISFTGALIIAALSLLYALAFIFGRTKDLPLNHASYWGSFHAPIILLYAIAFVFSLVESILSFGKSRRIKVGPKGHLPLVQFLRGLDLNDVYVERESDRGRDIDF